MLRLRYLLPIAVFTMLVLGVSLRTTQAQFDVETCPTIIEDALNAVGDNCGGLDRNSACYGYNVVQATFTEALANDFFSRPSDRSPISSLATIGTTPLRADLNQWGIALLSAQANLPDTLPGQNVIFMLLGDAEVENAVEPQNAYIPGGIANVMPSMGVDLRYEPDLNADVMGSVPAGTTVVADAITPDGQWLRVTHNGAFGWVLAGAVTTADDLAALGVYGENTRTPMQAFYFRNNITSTDCTAAPDALLVQGPQDLTIDITIAGADIRMGSTALFRIIPVDAALLEILRGLYGQDIEVGALLQLIAVDGEILINPDTPDEQLVRPGYSTTRCLSMPDDLGLDGQSNDGEVFDACPWSDLRPLAPEELEQFRALDGFGEGVLNYPLEIPNLPEVTPTPTETFTRAPQVVVLPPATRTPTPTFTPTLTSPPTQVPPPPTNTFTVTNTWTITPTGTYFSPTPTHTFTPTPTFTSTFTETATFTSTFTPTFTPTHTDTPPGCPVSFPIDVPRGDVTALRQAIRDANNPACSGAVINLAADSSYVIGDPAEVVIIGNGLPTITNSITINGNDSGISRHGEGALVRLFMVAPGAWLQLNNLNLGNGAADTADGGAIHNSGTLILNGVTLYGHQAHNGGAIYNAGSLQANYSSFRNSRANNAGGAVYNTGSASFDHVIIEGNYAINIAGALANNGGTMSVTNSAIVYNDAGIGRLAKRLAGVSSQGGGMYNNGTLNMLNVTVFGNGHASGPGGNLFNAGTANLSFVTIAGGGASGSGNVANVGTVNAESSLIAGFGDSTSCSGSFNATNSYSDDSSCGGFSFVPDLGLENGTVYTDGGFSPVARLLPGSAVIDILPDCTDLNGNNITSDQVGGGRPEDGDQNGSFQCDPGAYEHDPFDFYGGGT